MYPIPQFNEKVDLQLKPDELHLSDLELDCKVIEYKEKIKNSDSTYLAEVNKLKKALSIFEKLLTFKKRNYVKTKHSDLETLNRDELVRKLKDEKG